MGKCTVNTGCASLITSNCVIYTGSYLPNYEILPNTTLTEILKIIDKAKVDISSSVTTTNTNTLQLFGNGDDNNPLYGNVLISNDSTNNISILPGQGLFSPKQGLQSVTDVGNITNNSILLTASNNYQPASGLQFYYNSFGYGVIESNDGSSPNRLDFITSIANFNCTIVGATESISENSNKLASTAWVKQQNYITNELDPVANSKTISITPGTGISVIGATQTVGNNPQFVIAAQNSSPIWNANNLQSVPVSNIAPLSGQVLVYDGSQWAPGASSGGVGSVSITSPDLIVTGSPITSVGTINLELPDIVTSGTYNNVTISPNGLVINGSNVNYLTSESDPTVPDIVKTITQQDIDNWNNAFDKFTSGLSVTGTTTKTITITLNDSSVVQSAFTDDNNYPTSISYNNTTGLFTLNRSGLSALTVNLTDDRYALKTTTILPTGNGITGGGDLSSNRTFSLDFSYLDDRYLGGYKQRAAVRVATIGNITFSGSQTVDGVSLTNGDRVLVKNQSNPAENGIYIYNSGGSWTRATDFDEATSDEISQGSQIFVQEGTINSKTGWSLSSAEPYTIGTTSLIFIQYAGANSYTAGTGLNLTGNQFSAQTTSAIWNASQIRGINVSSSSPTLNQTLTYDGTNWTPLTASIGLSMPSVFSVTGSPVNFTGSFTVALNTQSANTIFAGPSSGVAAVPTFRLLTATDIPPLDASKITSGTFPITRGGTGLSSLGTPLQLLRVNSAGTNLEYFSSNFLTSNQNITLTGDITGSGTTSITTTISNNVVTYAKIQDITAVRLLGRYSSTTGDAQEITIGSGLSLNSTTGVLSATTSGVGTVTSVGLSLPSLFSVSGSPVTSSGTLTAVLVSQSQNLIFASPNGTAGIPAFRAIVNNDLPDSGVTTGTYNTITVNSKGLVTSATNTSYVPITRSLTIVNGIGITVSPNTAQDLSSNRTWTITNTGVLTVNGNTGDVTVAPASGSGNYIQNTTTQQPTSNFNISGTGVIAQSLSVPTILSNSSSSSINLIGGSTGTGSNRGGQISIYGGTNGTAAGCILFFTGTGGGGTIQPEVARLTATGILGINTSTPEAGTKLHVNGTSVLGGNTRIVGGLEIQSSNPLITLNNNTNTNIFIQDVAGRLDFNNANSITSFTGAANVAIGASTVTSGYKLDVTGAIRSTGATNTFGTLAVGNPYTAVQYAGLRPSNWPNTTYLIIGDNNTGGSTFISSQAGGSVHLRADANSATKFLIVDGGTGNVGIGVSDPDAKLEINGQIKITGGSPAVNKILTSDASGLATWAYGPKTLASFYTSVSNDATPGGSNLMNYVVPASFLANAGDKIVVEYGGTLPSSSFLRQVGLNIAGNKAFNINNDTDAGGWNLRATIIRVNDTTVRVVGTITSDQYSGLHWGSSSMSFQYTVPSIAANGLQVSAYGGTGGGTANVVTATVGHVTYYPA